MFRKKNSYIKIEKIMKSIVKELEEKRDYLNRLDGEIGDGDHGRTINNAFKKAQEVFLESGSGIGDGAGLSDENADLGTLLKGIGRTIAFSTGAAAGPLYGTAFIEAGKAIESKEKLHLQDWVRLTEAAEEGIIKRGKGKVGEKTMLDTLHPMFESLKEMLAQNKPLEEALKRAKKAAWEGMESTRKMLSKRGRSSRLGERTRGHIDPGAASTYYIIKAIIETCLD